MDKIVNQGVTKIETQNIYLKSENSIEIYDNLEFTETFQLDLDKPGIGLIHPRKEQVEFDDLYTCPDLKSLGGKSKRFKFNQYRNLNDIIEKEVENFNIMLLGDDISGKSASLKYLTKWFYYRGFVPIMLRGQDINSIRMTSILMRLKKQFKKQYKSEQEFETIITNDPEKFVIMIDDFHLCAKKRRKYWYYLIKNLRTKFSNIILTGKNHIPLETLLSDSQKPVDIFEEFDLYALQVFGPKLRYKIAEKWNNLGIEFPRLEKKSILEKTDTAVRHIEQIIGKGYVPSYPLYILALLQAFDSQKTIQNPQYSIHGFYYELLINTSLSKAIKDVDDIGVFNNLLSHIAYYFFINRKSNISKEEFINIVKEFIKEIDIEDRFSTDSLLSTLVHAKLLNVDETIYFYPKYVYYFFVAKYLANNLNSHNEKKAKKAKDFISKLSKRLYHDEFSSIIIFLTHLSKDKFIINELLCNSEKLFAEFPITKLEDDVKQINDLINDLPEQVLELMTIEKAREEQLDFQEKVDISKREIKEGEEEEEEEAPCHYEDDIMNIDLLEKLTLAINTIEILGQITKKYWGELDGELKLKIATETYFLGLRTMSLSGKIIIDNQASLIELLKYNVEKKLIDNKRIITNFDIKNFIKSNANQYLFRLAFLSKYGIIKRISNSIGSKKISNTLSKIVEQHPYNSIKLIDISVKLDFRYSFPWGELSDKNYIDSNNLSHLIKQNLITHYLYIYETDYKQKLKIADRFNIKVKDQLLIDNTSKVKRKGKKNKK